VIRLVRRDSGQHRLVLTAGPLTLDVVRRTVARDGEPIDLAAKEFEVDVARQRHRRARHAAPP
jgi:DNA-binding response OmpR family regulator